jgi:hypothetical protein
MVTSKLSSVCRLLLSPSASANICVYSCSSKNKNDYGGQKLKMDTSIVMDKWGGL